MLREFKYRMYPTKNQEEMVNKHFGACRYVYNWGLEYKIRTYKETGKSISRFALNKEITLLKQNEVWLKEINSQSLQGATLNLDNAFTRCYREKKGFPHFKSKKNRVQSFNVPQNYKVDFNNNTIYLPKIGWVKTKLHRQFKGKTQTATITMTNTGKYYISILIDDKQLSEKVKFNQKTTVGLDMGLTHFLITSKGVKVNNPRPLKQQLKRLKREQRKLSRKKRGSNNRNKKRLKISKIHERIMNIREDFQHKLSKVNIRDFALDKQNLTSTVGITGFKASLRKPQKWIQ